MSGRASGALELDEREGPLNAPPLSTRARKLRGGVAVVTVAAGAAEKRQHQQRRAALRAES